MTATVTRAFFLGRMRHLIQRDIDAKYDVCGMDTVWSDTFVDYKDTLTGPLAGGEHLITLHIPDELDCITYFTYMMCEAACVRITW